MGCVCIVLIDFCSVLFWFSPLIFKVRVFMVTPELSDLSATWISDNKATGVSSITLQLRGNISDTTAALVNTPHPYTTLDASVNFNSFLDLKYIT
jgi:hypothetical protein